MLMTTCSVFNTVFTNDDETNGHNNMFLTHHQR